MNSLQYIPVDNLRVHPRYQRTLDANRAAYIAQGFEPGRALALGVCPDPMHPGSFLVWDGGHRLEAARLSGVPSLACVIADITPEKAGEWFVHQDDGKSAVSPLDKHRVRLNVGDPVAVAIQAAADERGMHFVPSRSGVALAPNECDALSVIYEKWKKSGALIVPRVFDTVLSVWPTDPDRWSFDLFRALFSFWKSTPNADVSALANALRKNARRVASLKTRSTPVPELTKTIKVFYYESLERVA